MYYNMLNKAIYLLTEYQIFEYPIDRDTVADSNLRLVTLNHLSATVY